ncbi:hypothetical protein CMA01_21140 [Carnobacterium maltaromaticum]|nr:hypothetical protein CMA01_21140 [Carnobacterium maltaromaticum]
MKKGTNTYISFPLYDILMVVEKLDGKIERFDYEEVKKDVEMAKKHLS